MTNTRLSKCEQSLECISFASTVTHSNSVEKGEIFVGTVSNVINQHTFYAVEQEILNKLKTATQSLNKDSLEIIFWIPGVGDLFLVDFVGDGLLRAARINCSSNEKFRFRLLDTGEKYHSSIDDLLGSLFLMPEHLEKIPPAAVLCTWQDRYEGSKNSDVSFEEVTLYKKYTFEVLQVKSNGSILVNMWSNDDGSALNSDNGGNSNETKDTSELEISMEHLKELLDKEEPTNFDAQVAVQGFHTRDDDRRCKFYDPKTGGCWKGGNCKLEHVPEIDGAFRDTKNIHYYDRSSPPLPKCNFCYPIKIISFCDANRFIFTCHYIEGDKFYKGKKLEDLRKEINSDDHENLTELPAIGELVTVKIGKSFHRARIIEEVDDFMTIPVFLVDEGIYNERVPYDMIYKYCAYLQDYPFFAVEMEIADVKPLKYPIDREAKEFILEVEKRSGPLKAFIV